MAELSLSEFEALVAQALAELPEEIQQHLDNVAVAVAEWPSARDRARAGAGHSGELFGLYEGVPLTERGHHYNLVPPDRITIFRGPLQAAFRRDKALREQVRRTVVHEIGHHLGMSEARIRELGY